MKLQVGDIVKFKDDPHSERGGQERNNIYEIDTKYIKHGNYVFDPSYHKKGAVITHIEGDIIYVEFTDKDKVQVCLAYYEEQIYSFGRHITDKILDQVKEKFSLEDLIQ